MENLNEMGVTRLNRDKAKNIYGGRSIFDWIGGFSNPLTAPLYAFEAAQEIAEGIKEGYQDARS